MSLRRTDTSCPGRQRRYSRHPSSRSDPGRARHFRWQGKTLILAITVQTGASECQFTGLHGNLLKIRIHAVPVDGKANSALIEYLATEFAVPRNRITLIRGTTSRTKTLSIEQPRTLPAKLLQLGLTPN